jgi:hypothetical protein
MTGRGRTDRVRRRRRYAAVTVILMALCQGAGTAGAAPGEEPAELSACPVVAAAQAVSTTVQKDGDLTLAKPVGAQAPAAQVCLDAALGDSTAYASAAYPGATVVAAPGAAADFPGYVSSSYPGTPEAKADSPAFVVRARSSESSSEATAQTGPPPAGTTAGNASAEAKGTVDTTSRTAHARASAVSTPISVAGLLTLGQVRSTAEARLRQDGTIERASSLEVGGTTVGGQVVTIRPDGLHAAGQTVPLPSAEDPSEVLAQSGITITYLSAQKTSHGVLSAGLIISVVAKDSAGVPTVTSLALGRSFAAVALRGQDSTSASDPGTSPGLPSGSAQGPSGGPSIVPDNSGDAGSVTAPAGGVGAAPQVAGDRPRVLLGGVFKASLGSFYAVLVLGGLVLLVGCTSVRLLGVRTRWTS